MIGPQQKGYWSSSTVANSAPAHQFLRAGQRYRVIRAFVDFDKHEHPVGETWTLRGSSFLPYDDGLSLFVSLGDDDEWHIRMQWIPEQQGPILDALAEYVAHVPGA